MYDNFLGHLAGALPFHYSRSRQKNKCLQHKREARKVRKRWWKDLIAKQLQEHEKTLYRGKDRAKRSAATSCWIKLVSWITVIALLSYTRRHRSFQIFQMVWVMISPLSRTSGWTTRSSSQWLVQGGFAALWSARYVSIQILSRSNWQQGARHSRCAFDTTGISGWLVRPAWWFVRRQLLSLHEKP